MVCPDSLTREILLILLLITTSLSVRPVWRTPISSFKKNSTGRTQRASNSQPQDRYPAYQISKQVSYYTRPEDFKVPDYKPAKPNIQQPRISQENPNPNFVHQIYHPNPQQPSNVNVFENPRPVQSINQGLQYPLNSQYPSKGIPYQSGSQFFKGQNFQPDFLHQQGQQSLSYPTHFQSQYPQYLFNSNPFWNGGYIPPQAIPYWRGPGPIPPQGAYGPTTSRSKTVEPMKPSVNPETYQGTLPMQPSINPEIILVTSTKHFELQNEYNPNSTPIPKSQSNSSYNTSTFQSATEFQSSTDEIATMSALFESRKNPFESELSLKTFKYPSETVPTKTPKNNGEYFVDSNEKPPSLSVSLLRNHSKNETLEPMESLEKLKSSEILDSKNKVKVEESTEKFTSTKIYNEEKSSPYFDLTAFDRNPYTQPIIPTSTEYTAISVVPNVLKENHIDFEKVKTDYFSEPISTQIYQPPGHLPEDFSQHIDVNFRKPNKTCTGPLCGIDTEKVSLYNPEKGDGRKGPTLVISNAAKGDAARLGYIPPAPHPISEYGLTPYRSIPPSATEYYNQAYENSAKPNYPLRSNEMNTFVLPEKKYVPYGSTTEIPFHIEVPQNPHVFMPPQNFPEPPPPTQVSPAHVTAESTTTSSFSPTAKTIAPTLNPQFTRPFVKVTPPSVSLSSPSSSALFQPNLSTTFVFQTLSPFQSTSKIIINEYIPTYKPFYPETWTLEQTQPTQQPERLQSLFPESAITLSQPTKEIVTPPNAFSYQPTYRPLYAEITAEPSKPSSGNEFLIMPNMQVHQPINKLSNPLINFTQLLEKIPASLSYSPTYKPLYLETTTQSTHRPEEVTSSLFDNPFRPTFKTISPYENQEIIPSATHTSASTQPQLSPFIQPNPLIESHPHREISNEALAIPGSYESFETPTKPSTDIHNVEISSLLPTSHVEHEQNTVPTLRPLIGEANTTSTAIVQNRVRGKAHVICKEDGIEFSATTVFPFSGQIFANDRKRIPSCVHEFTNAIVPKVFLPFSECGIKNAGDLDDTRTQYHMQVVIVLQQTDGTSTVQSFMAQCVHQRILYNKQTLPRRIEEALEELRLVNTKLEQKAPLPLVEMKIVVDQHHEFGPEVSEVDIGMPLAVQWRLLPESDAFGFHVRNCVVVDTINGVEHKIIDEQGCSTDLGIFAHPHYDTYHDSASSHMWAFKVPDHARLRIKCDVAICSDISSSTSNRSNCALIPSPPFCPDLITSPSNSILYDAEGAFSKRRRDIEHREETQSVKAALCMGEACGKQPIDMAHFCTDVRWVATSIGFSLASMMVATIMHAFVRIVAVRRYKN